MHKYWKYIVTIMPHILYSSWGLHFSWVHIVVLIIYHQLTETKTNKSAISQFWKSGVWHWFHWIYSRCQWRLVSSWSCRGNHLRAKSLSPCKLTFSVQRSGCGHFGGAFILLVTKVLSSNIRSSFKLTSLDFIW